MPPDRSHHFPPQSDPVFNFTALKSIPFSRPRSIPFRATITLAFAATGSFAATPPVDFTSLDLTELLNVKVTSVSGKFEQLHDAAAAVSLVSNEEIRRLGAFDLPSALRSVPGLQIGRIDNTNTALSARGFNDISANKLLALLDGRTIYSPFYGGVNWSLHEVVLADLERIEVIRGPGATLWGANAVNGVINISTKSAHDTLGSLLGAEVGGLRRRATFRQGFTVGPEGHARVYAQQTRLRNYLREDGTRAPDPDTFRLAGLRYDRGRATTGLLTLQAEWRNSRRPVKFDTFRLTPPYLVSRAATARYDSSYALGRYTRELPSGTTYTVQSYLDFYDNRGDVLDERREIADLNFLVRHRLTPRHELVAGAGLRYHTDAIASGLYLVDEPTTSDWLASSFIQDEITLIPSRLFLTVGTKLEHNDTTGWELQPGLRASWQPNSNLTFWASATRAVRTPSRAERGTRIYAQVIPPVAPNPLPVLATIEAGKDYGSESLLAWEIGARFRRDERLSLDLAAYVNRYADVRSVESSAPAFQPAPVPHVLARSTSANGIGGLTYGGELSAKYSVTPHWRLHATASLIRYDLRLLHGSRDTRSLAAIPGNTPRQQFGLRSQFDFSPQWQFDVSLNHTAALPAASIPAYAGLGARLAWRPLPRLEVAFLARDLLDPRHPEFPPTFLGGSPEQIPRSFHVETRWEF